MRKITLALAATTALTLAAGGASAQTWTSINSRQAALDARIDAGVRNGDLNRTEAQRLRTEFNAIANLESRYRVNGLSSGERVDLDRRFDALSARIRFERTDNQSGWYGGRGWTNNRGQWVAIDQRQAQLDRRIDQGLRSGQLTRSEASRLRGEFNTIARIEARYRMSNGMSTWERADLDRRFDQLAAQIRFERTDNNRRYGYNDYPRY
jgi:hypothetical protein